MPVRGQFRARTSFGIKRTDLEEPPGTSMRIRVAWSAKESPGTLMDRRQPICKNVSNASD